VLKARYEHIQLRDTSELRLNNLCQAGDAGQSLTGMAASPN